MITMLQNMAIIAKIKVDAAFQRVFKEQAGGAELVATLVIIGIVLALALIFRNQLTNMISDLWNNLVAGGDTGKVNSGDVVSQWGA